MKLIPKAKKKLKKVRKQGFMARKEKNLIKTRRQKGRHKLVK